LGGGQPLAASLRETLEGRLQADLQAVRVHSDARAHSTAHSLSARAFTIGNHIFLGRGEQPTDLGLMAHEIAHVVQQQGAPTLQRWAAGQSDRYENEAHRASAAVLRGETFTVHERTSNARVQRLGLSDVLDGLAELAANIPGYSLLTVIIGRNPINMRVVERNFTNLLRGFMGLIPGGEILFQVLNRYGVVERLGNWVSAQVREMGLSYEYLRGRFTAFTDSLSWRDIFSPRDVWRRAEAIFTEPIDRIRAFVSRLVSQAITWLKETFMQPLSNFCREIPGYTLVTVILGRDPFTNAPVPRTALNVVRAFAEFIPGGTEKVNQLVESGALQRAYAWYTQEIQTRNLTWARVTGTFAEAWNSLRLEDILSPIETLRRTVNLFRPLMSDLVGFARAALMQLLEFIFEAAMGAGGARILAILKRARSTFQTIISNPVGFFRNLTGAVGQGVRQFRTNILRHLQQGVIAWLVGPVARAGIQMPERWDLRGIIWFVLQILGLTWDRVRQKLVNLMGERTVAALEAGFQLIQDIRRLGLVGALRERVTEFFGQLREAALGSIRTFIQNRLVMAGITQLLSLLNPVGAVIQAIIKTYTTIKFFIDRINQILDFVESIVNSIAAIASGALGQAANFVESTMARTIPLILDFLARFIGLGDVGGHVQRTIQGLQARVDQMLDRAVEWIRRMAQRVVAAGRSAVAAVLQWWRERRRFRQDNKTYDLYFSGEWPRASLFIRYNPNHAIRSYYDDLKNQGYSTSKQEMKDILANIKIIEDTNAKSGGNFTITDGNNIKQALDDIVKAIKALTGGAIPATNVKWKTKNINGSVVGKEMEAKVLSINPGGHAGSAPHETTDLWDAVNQRPSGYVLGHLLNHHVHGKGERENLVPISRMTNGKMSTRVEEKVKDAVFKDREVVYYKVNMVFGAQPKRKIPQEEKLPTKIEFVAYSLKKDYKTKKADLSIAPELQHELPPNDPLGRPREVINLNRLPSKRTDAIAKLDTVPQIGPALADKIVTAVKEIRKSGTAVHQYTQLTAYDSSIPSNVLAQLQSDGWVTLYPH